MSTLSHDSVGVRVRDRPIYQVKADFLKALAHPLRIRVLKLLADGETTVGELVRLTGAEPSSLSQQLSVLRGAGVVVSRRGGSNVYYTVKDPRIFDLLAIAKEILLGTLQENGDLVAGLHVLSFGEAGEVAPTVAASSPRE